MIQKVPNALHMLFGLTTLVWFGFAWDAYMQMNLYGSVLALFAGVSFLFLARESAPKKELPWLFGWNDDPITHDFLRMWVYASLFVGPITRHASEAVAPDFFEHKTPNIAVMIVSAVVGVGMSIYIDAQKSENVP